MDSVSPTTSPAPVVLSGTEQRLLGVLVEKAKTTPEGYPLSLNALTVGSNQKSNRDPVTNLTDDQVEAALDSLQQRGLVTRITGSRVDRWRHNLYEHWQVDKVELAILAELLLRGAQTEGELRGRASRMEPIDDLDALRQKLRPLGERKFVVFLGEAGRRGTQIAHGFQAAGELARLAAAAPAEPPAPVAGSARAGPSSTAIESELSALKSQVADLQVAFKQMQEEINALRASLGG